MARTVDDIKREQHAIIKKQSVILDKAEKEKRGMTDSEKKEYAELDRDFKDCSEEVRFLQNSPEYACWLKQSKRPPIKPTPEGQRQLTKQEEAAMLAASQGKGEFRMTEPEYRFDENGTEIRDAFNRYIKYGPSGINETEFRALAADSDVGGGYLVLPTELAKEILRGLDNELQIRQLARTFQLPNADSLGVPTMGDDFGDVTFTAELATGHEDSSLDLQRRDLHPHPMARRIKVSNKLLRVSSMNPEVFVRERMTQVCGQVLENAYLNGTGQNQPLGIFVNSAHGISSARDLTCSTQTAVKADDLIGAVGMLKQQYRKKAVWLAHRDFETAVRKLKTGDGDYLWKAGLEANGNTLLGFPLVLSEYAPSTFTSGKYVAVLANLDYYWIADALSMQITRLSELYAETNQTGYIIRHETDGMPTWQDGFVRLKMA